MKSRNKISLLDNKKKFFEKILNKLQKNNLLNHKIHLLMGTDLFENSLFKSDNLHECLMNKQKKSNFFSNFIRFLTLFFKLILFKFLTPRNELKKSNKKKILILSYLPQTNFFDDFHKFDLYQWGNNLDNLKSHFQFEFIHIFPLNFFSSEKFLSYIFGKNKKKKESHLFFLNYISFKEIIFLSFTTIFQEKIFVKNKDPIDNYLNESTKPHHLVQSKIWEKIFFNFFMNHNSYVKCYYLFENQNWEKFLLYYWKKFVNKDIIPFNHSICRYNDYRTFSSIYFSKFKKLKSYFPNKLVINDHISFKNIRSFDKRFKVFKVNSHEKEIKLNYKKNKIALIIGDINLATSEKLIKISLELKRKNLLNKIIYKPHPSNASKSKNNDYEVYFKELKYFKKDINYVFCANSTTSAAKIYQYFKKIFVYIPKNKINLSPLFNFDNKIFYSDLNKITDLIKNNSKKTLKQNIIYYKNLKSKVFINRRN